MHGVRLDALDGAPVMVATNGRVLAVVDVDGAEDDTLGALIPREALADARKARLPGGAHLHVNGTASVPGGASRPLIEGAFPDWQQILKRSPDDGAVFRIAFDPRLLAALGEALCSKGGGLTLTFHGPGLPIQVKGAYGRGVLMPMTTD